MKRLTTTLLASAALDGSYSLKPSDSSILTVRSADDSTIYMKATLGKGDLVPVGTIGTAYTSFTSDLTDVNVTEAGKAPGSAVLSDIVNSGKTISDFVISLQGESGSNYYSLAQMPAGGYVGGRQFQRSYDYSRAGDYRSAEFRLIGSITKTRVI